MARSSAKRKQRTEEGRIAGRLLIKKEKYTVKNESLRSTSRNSKGATFEKPRKRACQKEKSPASKARREASRNEFRKKSGMPHKFESLRNVNRSKNRPRIRLDLFDPSKID